MNRKDEEIEIFEQSSGYVFDGLLLVYNVEVGVNQVIVKIGMDGISGREIYLKVGQSITYDAGAKGECWFESLAREKRSLRCLSASTHARNSQTEQGSPLTRQEAGCFRSEPPTIFSTRISSGMV